MIIDTREEATTLWRTKTFAVVLFTLSLVLITVFASVSSEIKILACGGVGLIFLALYGYQYMMRYTYFYFSNNNKNLVFRFYMLHGFRDKPKTIEIAKINFYRYEIISEFFGRRESLILYQKTPKGIAKYPPISLTLLTKNQKTELKRALYATLN